jgi:hypothetical protein
MVVSHQVVNEWLQTISLSLGIIIGLVTLASIAIKSRRR